MSKRFIGGRDTTPEVEALRAAITPTPGQSITHDEVAAVCGTPTRTARFDTITARWRRMIERDTAIRIESRDRVFHFLSPDAALDRSKVDLHRIGKASGKLHVRVAAIDVSALTGERKDLHRLMSREAAALLDSARRSAKAIQGPRPPRPSLRIAK